MGIPLWKGPSSLTSSTSRPERTASPLRNSTSGIRRRAPARARRTHGLPNSSDNTPSSQTLLDLLSRGGSSSLSESTQSDRDHLSTRVWDRPLIHRALPLDYYDLPRSEIHPASSVDALMRQHWSLRHHWIARPPLESLPPPLPTPRGWMSYAGWRHAFNPEEPVATAPDATGGLGDRERSLSPDEAAAQWDLVANDPGFATACDDLWDSDGEIEDLPDMWARQRRRTDQIRLADLERLREEEARGVGVVGTRLPPLGRRPMSSGDQWFLPPRTSIRGTTQTQT